MKSYLTRTMALAGTAMLFFSVASADDPIDQRLKAVEKKLQQQQQVIDSQRNEIRELRAELDKGKAQQTMTRDEVKAVIKEASVGGSLPSWLDGLKIKGDFRLRYESIDNDTGNDTSRVRSRSRVGIQKKWDSGLETGLRLASASSGSGSPLTSTNSTLGGSFDNDAISIDRAYLAYTPEVAEWLWVTGGRFANPMVKTGILFDSDLNLDGLAEKASYAFTEDFELSLLAGQFILNQGGSGTNDTVLWAFQVDANAALTDLVSGELAIGYYNLQSPGASIAARTNTDTNSDGNPDFQFRIVDIVNKYKLEVAEMPLAIWINYVVNTANDLPAQKMNEDSAWGVGAMLGKLKEKGSWRAGINYKHIEQDAVSAAMNDQDFRRTNRKGIELIGGYQILDNLSLNLELQFTDKIEESLNGDVERILAQFDIIIKF